MERAKSPRSRLYLVPGYIGNRHDISLRAWDVLHNLRVIFIDEGKLEAAKGLFNAWNVPHHDKAFVIIENPKALTRNADQVELDENVAGVLDAIIANGEDCMFFGLDEGVPGFIDPGYSLLELARQREANLEVRTVGGGGALSAAIMRVMPRNTYQGFTFLGHLENWRHKAILDTIARIDPTEQTLSIVFFSHGLFIKEAWSTLQQSLAHLSGEIYLMANLTDRKEYTYRRTLEAIEQIPIDQVHDDDKLVIWIHPPATLPRTWKTRLRDLFRLPDNNGR